MINELLKEIGTVKAKDEKEFSKSLNAYLKGDKLEACIKDFWKNREDNKTAVREKYPSLMQQLTFYFILLQDINNIINETYKNKKDKDLIKQRINVCGKLYNKSLQIFIDIFGLLENGSVLNAFLLWRAIYENYIVSNYTASGAEEEAKLFNEYEIVQKNKLLNIKLTKEEKAKFVKKYGKDFETNDYCWAKNIKGKKTFLKIVRLVKEKKLYKYYQLSGYIGHSSSFSVNNGIVYDQKPVNNITGFSAEEVTKSLNVFINVMSEFANLMIEKYLDDKKQKETLKKLVSYYSKEIDKKWKKL